MVLYRPANMASPCPEELAIYGQKDVGFSDFYETFMNVTLQNSAWEC